MEIKIITPPATEPMTLDEAKHYLRISGTDDDTLIPGWIIQARKYCEGYQKRKYITQTLEGYLNNFPSGSIDIRHCGPVQAITSIIYTNSEGVAHTVDPADYSLDNISFTNKIDLAYGKLWPSVTLKPANGVKVTMVCGYGAASAVPETVKIAMALHMKVLHDDLTVEEREKMEDIRDKMLMADRVW